MIHRHSIFPQRALLVGALFLTAGWTFAEQPSSDQTTPAGRAEMKSWRKAALDRQRRIIFNNDGCEPVMFMKTPSAQQLLDLRTSPLAGTQVDSIFDCTLSSGFGLFTHFTKVGQVFTTTEGRFASNQMQALLERGIDPLQIKVNFCKRNRIEVFWSMRMNDTHDGAHADYGPLMFRANKLKNEHPEFLLGTRDKPPKYGAWSAVNYGRPEIRDLAYRYVEEVCHKYDIDGVELDFFRHPVFFQSTSRGQPATDEDRTAMTDLMRRIRAMTDDVGKQRGSPVLIAMRLPDSVEYSQAIGLDLKKWLAEDLLDLFIASGYFQLNDWNYSVALGRKYGVKVYPSLDEPRIHDASARAARATNLAYRGRAANVWAAGADGVYLFNLFDPRAAMWHELGDAQSLAKLDKDYFGSVRGSIGGGQNFPFQPYQRVETLNPGNPKTLALGKTATARIQVGESDRDNSRCNLKLRLQFKSPPNPKSIQAKLNGQSIDLSLADSNWLEATVAPHLVKQGPNLVELAPTSNAGRKLLWTDLMLQVRHPPEP
jgi:hypothetical protein